MKVSHRGSLQQLAMELDVRTRAKPTKPETVRVARGRKIEPPDTNGDNPPKPRPRNARSNSIEMNEDRPIAKPRMSRPDAEPEDFRPRLRRTQTDSVQDGGIPILRRANTCVQQEPDSQITVAEARPILRRSNTDMNEETKMRADLMESEKEDRKTVIQSVNPNLPVTGGYKVAYQVPNFSFVDVDCIGCCCCV